jgi:hypothetical protein
VLSIKKPCNEDWFKMTPTDKGAFCQACALEVIDFTGKTPFEIRNMLQQEFAPNKRTCIRITNFQMNQINDDFFKWKNDAESFKAIWLFSLIAVFGLTLFSCQNTASKELVNQLQIETTQLLNEMDSITTDLTEFEKDTDQLKPSSNVITITSIGGYPWEHEIAYQGVPPLDYRGMNLFDWKTITLSLEGFEVVYGGFAPEKKDTSKFVEFLAAAPNPFEVGYLPSFPMQPIKKPIDDKNVQKLAAVMNTTGKKFNAFIYPNPVEISSRLFIQITEKIYLKISIYNPVSNEYISTTETQLEQGKYALDLKLYDCAMGNYELHLDSIDQLSILEFMI